MDTDTRTLIDDLGRALERANGDAEQIGYDVSMLDRATPILMFDLYSEANGEIVRQGSATLQITWHGPRSDEA